MHINEQLKDRITHLSNLPTLPQVASRLMKIINDPLTSSSDAAFVIGQDLSLSAKVLRLANSAFYGIPRSITNLNNAVVILGLKVINTLVLSLTVFDLFPESRSSAALFDRKAFWLHSLSCGLAAKLLVSKSKKLILFDPEEAFCTGLLHDIGKVIMEQYFHEDFHEALKTAKSENLPLFKAEQKIMGFDHTDVTQWLTQTWNLPSEIHLPLIYHHKPSKADTHQDIIFLCHFSDWLCYETGMVINKKYPAPDLDPGSVNILQIQPDDILEIKKELGIELKKASTFYELAANG